jgi:hypothetical protein
VHHIIFEDRMATPDKKAMEAPSPQRAKSKIMIP